MIDYKKLYLLLFHAITDAAEQLDALNIGTAKEILISAQQNAEELYITSEPATQD